MIQDPKIFISPQCESCLNLSDCNDDLGKSSEWINDGSVGCGFLRCKRRCKQVQHLGSPFDCCVKGKAEKGYSCDPKYIGSGRDFHCNNIIRDHCAKSLQNMSSDECKTYCANKSCDSALDKLCRKQKALRYKRLVTEPLPMSQISPIDQQIANIERQIRTTSGIQAIARIPRLQNEITKLRNQKMKIVNDTCRKKGFTVATRSQINDAVDGGYESCVRGYAANGLTYMPSQGIEDTARCGKFGVNEAGGIFTLPNQSGGAEDRPMQLFGTSYTVPEPKAPDDVRIESVRHVYCATDEMLNSIPSPVCACFNIDFEAALEDDIKGPAMCIDPDCQRPIALKPFGFSQDNCNFNNVVCRNENIRTSLHDQGLVGNQEISNQCGIDMTRQTVTETTDVVDTTVDDPDAPTPTDHILGLNRRVFIILMVILAILVIAIPLMVFLLRKSPRV